MHCHESPWRKRTALHWEVSSPIFTVEQAGRAAGNANDMFILKPEVSTLLQPVTRADRPGLKAPLLAELTNTQAADVYYKNAAKELGKV